MSIADAEQRTESKTVPTVVAESKYASRSATQIIMFIKAMHGYKIYVHYDQLSSEEMELKKRLVTGIVTRAISK